MKRLGHPAYQGLSAEAVREAATRLPESGVPPEVLKVIHAVNKEEEDKITETFEVRTGNHLMDQFQPLYFATAFSFCFKHGTGCPDVQNSKEKTAAHKDEQHVGRRRSRNPEAPEVQIFEYATGMQRRAETQFRRDWTFGFTLWNYLFRTMNNKQQNAFMYCVPDENGQRRALTGKEIMDAVKEIQQKLVKGKYLDVSNQARPINGDLSKVRFAGISPAAEKILDNTEARSRNIPGTHEVRNTMRHQTHANRICHGTPLFVTFSPSERDNTLMLRLVRARQSDPSLSEETETNRDAQGRGKPELDVEFCSLSPEALAAELPPYDDRRAMLTKDPLACADGFRLRGVLPPVQIALRAASAGLGGAYTAHVSRTVYENPEEWEQKREETEKQWPEYRHSTLALSRPTYQSANDSVDEQTWRRLYLREDVEVLQQLKQHHVHNPPTEPGGPRTPLDHCRSKEDPTKCKAGFPRNQQLIDNTALLCKGLAEEMKMPVKGKRSALGRLWGPCNDPNLNGNHPALLAALHCNGDVQVPYRFPITEDLHDACGRCDKSCHAEQNLQEMTQQEQVNQAAQAGYACDYSNKRNPIAVHEVKEWQRSQAELATELENNPSSGYVGARASKRLMTQCFARGVVRGSVECANLIDNAGHGDPTAAETVKTAQTTEMSFNFGVQLLQAATEGIPLPVEREKLRSDLTKSTTVIAKKAVAQPQIWTLYGNRGKDPRL
ncbi:unnamed protein product, partial [Symbiodinium sp. KB8]